MSWHGIASWTTHLRSENETAQRNSERSRGRVASVPRAPPRERASLAIDRAFIDWIAYPASSGGACPGYLHHTWTLYHADKSHLLLTHAVRALAFGNQRGAPDDEGKPFSQRARACYGAALTHLRLLISSAALEQLACEDVIAAILLIDNWELLYSTRTDIRGCHAGALSYILTLYDQSPPKTEAHFSWWLALSYRSLLHYVLERKKPTQHHLDILRQLDPALPWARMMLDTWEIGILCAEAGHLLARWQEDEMRADAPTARSLVTRINTFVMSANRWHQGAEHTPGLRDTHYWYPCSLFERPVATDYSQTCTPDGSSQCRSSIHEPWVAAMCTSYWACILILQDCLIEFLESCQSYGLVTPSEPRVAPIQGEYTRVRRLTATVFQTIPSVISRPANSSSGQGVALHRLFALFPLSVIASIPSASPAHRDLAANWRVRLRSAHSLD